VGLILILARTTANTNFGRPSWRGETMATNTIDIFPCPVCTRPLSVKLTKKDKPYVTCDPCGVQVFVRGPAGIEQFRRLIASGRRAGTLERLEEIEHRYRLSCPECGHRFWIEPNLIETSLFDGSLKGFSCPTCEQVVSWRSK
jgi:DNA-directed RNA polymerase subunit RPC12/RpoP